jgi:hypothetical protein
LLPITLIFSRHHRNISRVLRHQSPRLSHLRIYLLLLLQIGLLIIIGLRIVEARLLDGLEDDGRGEVILVLQVPVIVRVIPVIFELLLLLFDPLRVPGAGGQSLLQGLLLEDPVVLEVEVELLPHK